MSRYDDFPDRSENPDRHAFIASELTRLQTAAPESPAETARKQRQRAERLAKADAFFGIYRGCFLGALPPGVSAGDDAAPRNGAGDD